jgi:hypothetical protein
MAQLNDLSYTYHCLAYFKFPRAVILSLSKGKSPNGKRTFIKAPIPHGREGGKGMDSRMLAFVPALQFPKYPLTLWGFPL